MVAAFMRIFGWARCDPLFAEQSVGASDFPTIGFCFSCSFSSAGASCGLSLPRRLIAGQLIFENLGIVTGVAVVDCGFAMNPGPPLVPRAASAATRLLGLGAYGETEAELRAARQQRCPAAGHTNKVLFDRCVTSPTKIGRQIYWHHQTKFTA